MHPREPSSRPMPLDQAHGLRQLFAHAGTRFVPLVSNPHVAFGGVLIERLCTALAECGRHTLVVDAAERSGRASEMAMVDLGACIESLSPQVSYLAARGLPLRHVDTRGSTRSFLQAVADAAPHADAVLVHAPAAELARLFSHHDELTDAAPLLLADDRPASVTHAYAGLKLLSQRAGRVVFDLLLAAAPNSPRADRIAEQIGQCADHFVGAVLRHAVRLDPASDASEPPPPALRQLVRHWLDTSAGATATPVFSADPAAARAAALL